MRLISQDHQFQQINTSIYLKMSGQGETTSC